MPGDGARPAWFWALLSVAAVKVLVGTPGLLLPDVPDGPASPFPGWLYLATMAVYVTAGGVLVLGGRRDPRAVLLGGVFVLAASMAADRGLVRIGAFGPPALASASAVLSALDPGAFRPLLVWMFACTFPRDALTGAWRRLAAAGRLVCAAVGLVLFGVSLWAALDLLGGTASMPDGLRQMLPGDPSDRSYPLVTPLTLAGLPLVLLNMRAAGRSDQRRAEVFVAGLVLGTGPILTEAAAEYFIPAYGRFMSEPTPRFWSGVVFYPLLYGGLAVAAYAVYSGHVLSVRLVIRKAVRYAFARATLLGMLLAPFPLLAWLMYQQRDAPLRSLLTGPRQLALIALVAGAALLLRIRRPLLTALDRRFFREQYDSRHILASLIESGRSASSVAMLARHVTTEIDRALHVTKAAFYLLDHAGTAFHPVDAEGEPLAAQAALATLLRGSETPMDVGPAAPSDALSRLPPAERAWVDQGGYRLLVPVSDGKGGLAGLIALGEKRSELPYGREDRWLLSATASSAALAIARLQPSSGSPGPSAIEAEPVPAARLDAARECARCATVHAPGVATCPTCGSGLLDAAVPLVVHGLLVERRIGAGGMGVVYGATDLALRRPVAVKTLPAVSLGHARQLRREARAMAALSHPNLATIYAVDVWRGTPLLIVEYLQGGTLRDALRDGPLAIARVLEVGVLLAGALAHMHELSILHRDIKPSNIGFTASGVPKLLDFGLAKIVGAATSGTLTGATAHTITPSDRPETSDPALLIGTPAYFSPELATLHPPDARSDLWALALSLYEGISGTNPLAGATHLETLERIAHTNVPPLESLRADCPPEVSLFFARALGREVEKRPGSAREVERGVAEMRARL